MDLIPDAAQLSNLMSLATALAFVLGAVAAFVAVLLSRMTTVIERIRSLNEIATKRATHPVGQSLQRKEGLAPYSCRSLRKALTDPRPGANDVQNPLARAKWIALFTSFARCRNRGISDLR
jgi:hypothetical protein